MAAYELTVLQQRKQAQFALFWRLQRSLTLIFLYKVKSLGADLVWSEQLANEME